MKQKRLSRKQIPTPVEPEPQPPSTPPGALFWLMAGLSGFACLIYQILWMRQAGLLLGNTSHAAALTLAVFFGGLSLGGWQWGKRCGNIAHPLRTYVLLELGIAASGIVLLIAPFIIPRVYPMLGEGFGLTAFRLALTLLMVFPASFLMGGTLPVLGQSVIRRKESFGAITARMYAVNTLGAACGAFATAFVLIWWLGIRMTCATAMVASVAAAFIALRLSRRECFQNHQQTAERKPVGGNAILPRPLIIGFAFVSGFNLLALEVVWTRMMAQIHENSVYGFATVLIVVLVCLSLGAWLASRLASGGVPFARILLWLFALGGTALALTPSLSMAVTGGMEMLDTDFVFAGYVLRLFVTAAAAIAPACLPLGAVFPLLMKGEEAFITHAGKSIGILSAVNTIGAILGSLAAGFLLLSGLGMWLTIQLIAAIYLLLAIITPASGSRTTHAVRIAAVVMLALVFTRLDPSKLPAPAGSEKNGRVVETWEGSDSTVTVNETGPQRYSIRINSNYSLGSTDAFGPQMLQARIPLLAWPESDSVFFLGMGTGITAGEALNREDFPQIRKIVACELSAHVVEASRKYFTRTAEGFDLTNGLFTDSRAEVVVADGRNRLMADREKFSMINADLFLPYRRGTGNLYSREHFQIVRERLKPGGVFVQWLPLYQMSEQEFGTIARTMLAVFPQVSLWRGNFLPGGEIAALVGHADDAPLPAAEGDMPSAPPSDMQEFMLSINPRTVPLFYGGNLTRAADLFAKYPLNTDDKPIIEFGTPRSLHQPKNAARPQFLETRFSNLVDTLQRRTPPDQDPLLSNRSPADRKLPLAGSAFHRGWIARVHGEEEAWKKEWETFLRHWTDAGD